MKSNQDIQVDRYVSVRMDPLEGCLRLPNRTLKWETLQPKR